MIQVLIVEDEIELAELLKQLIEASGMNAHIIRDGRQVIPWVKENKPDVIVLDIMLPGKDGTTICQEVRRFSDVPIIMATAKVEEIDRLVGFEIGANDYVCKPYSSKEIIARISSLVRLYRRTECVDQSLKLDAAQLRVMFNEQAIELSALEFRILSLLYNHPKRVYSREQIITMIYEDGRAISDRAVDSHIKNLRKKLNGLNAQHDYIRAVYGAGYKFEGE